MRHVRDSYFSRGDEGILNVLVALGFVALAVEMIFSLDLNPVPDEQWSFFYRVFLLSSIHQIFPFVLLGCSVSGLAFVREKFSTPGQSRFFIGSFFFIFLLSAGLAVVGYGWGEKTDRPEEHFFLLFWLLVPLYHAIRQSWGISILMTKSHPESEEKTRLAQMERKAMTFYSLLFALLMVAIGLKFHVGIQSVLSVSLMVLVGALIWKMHQSGLFRNSGKLVFMLRFFLWPFFPFSKSLQVFLGLTHAWEYIALLRRSRGQISNINLFFAVIALAAVYVIGVETFKLFKTGESVVSFLVMLSYFFFAISHYFIDGVIYRFSDPLVRKYFSDQFVGFYQEGISFRKS